VAKCLESILNQTYKEIEILILDTITSQKTIDIINRFKEKLNIRILKYDGKLLGARALGCEKSKGDFVMLIDGDQVLEPTMIEKAVRKMQQEDVDALFLYERSYKPKNILEKFFDADRIITQNEIKHTKDPYKIVSLPRFYKRSLLTIAFRNIPKEILPICASHDHAIIYIEFYKLSQKVELLEGVTIYHMEPNSFKWFWNKSYRWGATTDDLEKTLGKYAPLIAAKRSLRTFSWEYPMLSLKVLLLRLFRGIPYGWGYVSSKEKNHLKRIFLFLSEAFRIILKKK